MILAVHGIAANKHDSNGIKPLIPKLGYKLRKVYADKSTRLQTTCLTFIVETSKTV
ncbi:MAG: hypothetical protein ACMUEL_03120 [Flavobacteriales bacterium Tduv]